MAVPTSSVVKIVPERSMMLVCDMQVRFRPAIRDFDKVVATTNKMLRIARVIGVPVVVTEQNPKALGPTVPEIDLPSLGPLHLQTIPKSLFSMVTPELHALLQQYNIKSVIIMGIESHICVLISALDLLSMGYDVHILADGVSSSNPEEVPFALERMRQAGACISTSESVAFQLQLDSAKPNFKIFAGIIKEEKERTRDVLQAIVPLKL